MPPRCVNDYALVPVVNRADSRRLEGVVSRQSVFKKYGSRRPSKCPWSSERVVIAQSNLRFVASGAAARTAKEHGGRLQCDSSGVDPDLQIGYPVDRIWAAATPRNSDNC
jgi:hypothetical protein